MKIAIGIVLYYPSKEDIKRISDYENFFEKIFIVDNTDSNNSNSEKFVYEGTKFDYFSERENIGISSALNLICKNAKEEGFSHIIVMDQDSIFKYEDLKKFLHVLKNKIIWEKTAVVAPNIIYDSPDKVRYVAKLENSKTEIEEVEWVITSASCINLNLFSIIGDFEEKYFIDRVDEEFCYRSRCKGFEILKIKTVNLYQQLGENERIKIVNYSEHSAIRNYYIARNRLYFYNIKYKNIFKRIFLISITTVKQIVYIMLFDAKNKNKKIKYIIKGVIDYTRKKEGKFSE